MLVKSAIIQEGKKKNETISRRTIVSKFLISRFGEVASLVVISDRLS